MFTVLPLTSTTRPFAPRFYPTFRDLGAGAQPLSRVATWPVAEGGPATKKTAAPNRAGRARARDPQTSKHRRGSLRGPATTKHRPEGTAQPPAQKRLTSAAACEQTFAFPMALAGAMVSLVADDGAVLQQVAGVVIDRREQTRVFERLDSIVHRIV
jgi:hypothetical protein